MHVVLTDLAVPVPVTESCIARSSVLQQACEAEADAIVHLPFNQHAWADWAHCTSAEGQPLIVARVRACGL